MKKFLLLSILLAAITVRAQQEPAFDKCKTDDRLKRLLETDNEYARKLSTLEEQVKRFIRTRGETPSGSKTIIVIPVVVHIIWNTAAENISNERILSQIKTLNEDFRRKNADTTETPVSFQPHAADLGIEFRLADRDPQGNPHTGINRVYTNKSSFPEADEALLKSLSYWDSEKYLNLWSADITSYILGYATFPYGTPSLDGVVINYKAFGNNPNFYPYTLGRTATHEVGHWLNLYHIWADEDGCSGTDYCEDTPNQSTETYGCGTGRISCQNTNMVENYMDYSDDACMNLFTKDQKDRCLTALTIARSSLLVSYKQEISISDTGKDYIWYDASGTALAVIRFKGKGTLTRLTVETFPGYIPPSSPAGSKAVKRYFKITGEGTGFNASVTFFYKPEEAAAYNNLSGLKVYTLAPGWMPLGGVSNTADHSVSLSEVKAFGIFAISSESESPLPVELISFNASPTDKAVALSWETATELNNRGFEVERKNVTSRYNTPWQTIGFVNGHNNSTVRNSYRFNDNPGSGTFSYRLKIMDHDGSYSYSNEINTVIEMKKEYSVAQNYPNPFNPTTSISFTVPEKCATSLRVYNILGVEVAKLFEDSQAKGDYTVQFNAHHLASGIYFYTLRSGNYSRTMKMIIAK